MGEPRDYIKCVQLGIYEIPEGEPGGPKLKDETWCGKQRKAGLEIFLDASHAAIHAHNKGYYLICKECAEAICKAIQAHTGG